MPACQPAFKRSFFFWKNKASWLFPKNPAFEQIGKKNSARPSSAEPAFDQKISPAPASLFAAPAPQPFPRTGFPSQASAQRPRGNPFVVPPTSAMSLFAGPKPVYWDGLATVPRPFPIWRAGLKIVCFCCGLDLNFGLLCPGKKLKLSPLRQLDKKRFVWGG